MREVNLTMPKLSMTMERGDLVSWERAEGDKIRSGDVVCMIVSDKAEMEVEAPLDGVLARIVSSPGDSVPVGGTLAVIETESEEFISDLFETPRDEPVMAPHAEQLHTSGPAVGRRGIIPAVPAARRRAEELDVVLASVSGSGPGGVITVQDIELFATSARGRAMPARTDEEKDQNLLETPSSYSGPVPNALRTGPGLPLELTPRAQSILRQTARVMSESAAVPQFSLFRLLELDAMNKDRGSISWTTIFVAALSAALRRYPRVNGSWDEGRGVVLHDQVRLGLAIDTDDGLLAPVLLDPDMTPLIELSMHIKETVERARNGRLRPDDTASPTFTLSNLGALGVDMFQALVTPPQAAVLSMGKARRQVVATDDGLAFRLGCWAGLTCDHRVLNGADGARFLAHVASLLEADRATAPLSFSPPLSPAHSHL